MAPPVTKIAILGGGCGALSAAFWLSATPQLRASYEVTVYAQGWRLGGKGASGRAPGNGRIEEHGLHMMMGFYETVFKTIADCYSAMPRQPGDAFTSWRQAFVAQRRVSLWLHLPVAAPSEWLPMTLDFPQYPGTPGDDKLELAPSTDYMADAIARVLEMLAEKMFARLVAAHPGAGLTAVPFKTLLDSIRALHGSASPASILHLLRDAQFLFKTLFVPGMKARFEAAPPTPSAFELYTIFLFIDLGLAGLIGLLSDVQSQGEAGYDTINHLDFKDWLQSHQADPVATASPLVMCLYDLAFAYLGGDSSTPANGQAAAGAMLRLCLRLALTYKDAPLWKMNGGMGDIIFTPLYRTLESRGVRFEFFRRASALHVAGGRIAAIDFQVQAQLLNPPYQPLERLAMNGGQEWDCWPSQPRWDQLVNGAVLAQQGVDFEDPWTQHSEGAVTLADGVDFDQVILAIPPAAARPITAEISAASPAWLAMLNNTHSVATQSLQMWLKPPPAQLGVAGRSVAICYEDPWRTWSEMSHLLPYECWPAATQPGSCEYLCGTLKPLAAAPAPGSNDPAFLPTANLQVRQAAATWLANFTGGLWPGVSLAGGGLDTTAVVAEYGRANLAYSELYVQTLPSTVGFRLDPGWRGMANLLLAGDWTLTSINGGCAEAAFESGLRAACAITGQPPPELP
jgi:uncharacterized protein with NAD-binding domain and iron-sulfur cluster